MIEKIKEIIEDITGEKVDENTDLIEEGFLDSFDIVSLVLELNDAFGIKIEVAELLPEKFSNINDIEKLVKSLQ
ncbi:MAG: acyl carrier protein [Peptoniphilus lacrimalis]